MLNRVAPKSVDDVNLAVGGLQYGRVRVLTRIALQPDRIAPGAAFVRRERDVQRSSGIVLIVENQDHVAVLEASHGDAGVWILELRRVWLAPALTPVRRFRLKNVRPRPKISHQRAVVALDECGLLSAAHDAALRPCGAVVLSREEEREIHAMAMQFIADRKNQRSVREKQSQVARQPAKRVVIKRFIFAPGSTTVAGGAIEQTALVPSCSAQHRLCAIHAPPDQPDAAHL